MTALGTTPTSEQFSAYQAMYDHFNRELFSGQLPPVILNFSRRARSLGFFAPERWEDGRAITHEISLNPSHLKERAPIAVAATLVHEMVHLWQQERGTPSRVGYHNAEWAERMAAIGLVPSDTGEPGGRKVGQHMSHYVDARGAFLCAYQHLPADMMLPWQCIPEPDRDRKGVGGTSRNKMRYRCSSCAANVWGKPGLAILCGGCGRGYEPAPEAARGGTP